MIEDNEEENVKRVEETKKITSPFEQMLNLPEGSTEITVTKPVTESTSIDLYDKKDNEIERQLDAVKDMAQYAFETIQDGIGDVEPKYSSRMNEVANGYLTTMLNAIKIKSKMKIEKDKIHTKAINPKISNTTNNTIIANTADIIDQLKNGKMDTINGEVRIIDQDKDDE